MSIYPFYALKYIFFSEKGSVVFLRLSKGYMAQKLCRTLSRTLRRWEDNIKADLRNRCKCMDALPIAEVKCRDGYV